MTQPTSLPQAGATAAAPEPFLLVLLVVGAAAVGSVADDIVGDVVDDEMHWCVDFGCCLLA